MSSLFFSRLKNCFAFRLVFFFFNVSTINSPLNSANTIKFLNTITKTNLSRILFRQLHRDSSYKALVFLLQFELLFLKLAATFLTHLSHDFLSLLRISPTSFPFLGLLPHFFEVHSHLVFWGRLGGKTWDYTCLKKYCFHPHTWLAVYILQVGSYFSLSFQCCCWEAQSYSDSWPFVWNLFSLSGSF